MLNCYCYKHTCVRCSIRAALADFERDVGIVSQSSPASLPATPAPQPSSPSVSAASKSLAQCLDLHASSKLVNSVLAYRDGEWLRLPVYLLAKGDVVALSSCDEDRLPPKMLRPLDSDGGEDPRLQRNPSFGACDHRDGPADDACIHLRRTHLRCIAIAMCTCATHASATRAPAMHLPCDVCTCPAMYAPALRCIHLRCIHPPCDTYACDAHTCPASLTAVCVPCARRRLL
jgi:hypothetical protein